MESLEYKTVEDLLAKLEEKIIFQTACYTKEREYEIEDLKDEIQRRIKNEL